MNGPNGVHTDGNAVPSLDGTDLGDLLEDLTANPSHPGIVLICDGIRLLASDRHDINRTQVLLAELAGSPDSTDVLGLIGHLAARLANADTNPALRTIPLDQQKEAAHQGWLTSHHLTDPSLRNSASNANAALDTPRGDWP